MSQEKNSASSFSTLHACIKKAGLLRKQSHYYDWVILRTLLMFVSIYTATILVRMVTDSFLPHIPIALALGCAITQMGFILHDTGHGQLSTKYFPMALVRRFGNLFLCVSMTAWFRDHTAHHDNPNDERADPDSQIKVFAFTKRQAQSRSGWYRFIAKYQAYLFIPVSLFSLTSMRITAIGHVLRGEVEKPLQELVVTGTSAIVYIAAMLFIHGWHGLLFIAVAELTAGLYMGLAFITNHRGRPDFSQKTVDDFLLKQVETARNISSRYKPIDTLIHFMYGGLNCQIEHHLWPYMPRCNLRKARKIVQDYCREHGVDYHSVSIMQTYKEVFLHFSHMSKFVH